MSMKRDSGRAEHAGRNGQPDLKQFVQAIAGNAHHLHPGKGRHPAGVANWLGDRQNKLIDVHNLRK